VRGIAILVWAAIVIGVVYSLVGASAALVLMAVIIVARLCIAAGNGLVGILPYPVPNLFIIVFLVVLIGGGFYLFSNFGFIPVAGLVAVAIGYGLIVGSQQKR